MVHISNEQSGIYAKSSKCKKLTLQESGLPAKYFNKLQTLNSAIKIQNFLDKISMNFEEGGETYMSPLRVLTLKKAHCLEGALLASLALWIHGRVPLLLDLKSHNGDDHICCLYQENGYWGAISKTNHATLRFRDPVYLTIRELVLSYFHEYFDLKSGEKILRTYSEPFDMRKWGTHAYVVESSIVGALGTTDQVVISAVRLKSSFLSEKYFKESAEMQSDLANRAGGDIEGCKKWGWITTSEEMQDLAEAIDLSAHVEIFPKKNIKFLRNADSMERKASGFEEWN